MLAVAATAALAAVQFKPLSTLGDVARSGDQYPQSMPATDQFTKDAFKGKTVLIAMSHGVEDHEVIYQHQYFTDRGAAVVFGCPQSVVPSAKRCLISDFFRPTHSVHFVDLDTADLDSFDAVFIPGGLPSSSDLRRSPDFGRRLFQFWTNPANIHARKLLAIICSGTETMIESGILRDDWISGNITGSPASKLSLQAALNASGKDPHRYRGTDQDSRFDAVVYRGMGKRVDLVLGRNPNASPRFVVAIGRTWAGLNEAWNGTQTPLRVDSQGRYQSPQFEPLASSLPVAEMPAPAGVQCEPPKNARRLAGRTVALVASSGVQTDQAMMLTAWLEAEGAAVTVVCPAWIPVYKKGSVYLFSQPPTRPTHVTNCSVGLDSVGIGKAVEPDVVVVPGGSFSTNAALRNDGDLSRVLTEMAAKSGGVVGLLGSGGATLLSAPMLPSGTPLPTNGFDHGDLVNVGMADSDPNWRAWSHARTVSVGTSGGAKIVVGRSPYADAVTGDCGLYQFAEALV